MKNSFYTGIFCFLKIYSGNIPSVPFGEDKRKEKIGGGGDGRNCFITVLLPSSLAVLATPEFFKREADLGWEGYGGGGIWVVRPGTYCRIFNQQAIWPIPTSMKLIKRPNNLARYPLIKSLESLRKSTSW